MHLPILLNILDLWDSKAMGKTHRKLVIFLLLLMKAGKLRSSSMYSTRAGNACQYLLAITEKNLTKAFNFTGHKGKLRPGLGWVKGAGGILCRSHLAP